MYVLRVENVEWRCPVTTKKASHFCGAIFWMLNHGRLEFGFIKNFQSSVVQFKFPGGTDKQEGEHPHQTLYREVLEEVGVEIFGARHLSNYEFDDKRGHKKLFFLIDPKSFVGDFRTVELKDDDGEILSPLIWQSAVSLKGKMFGQHAVALKCAIEYMRNKEEFRFDHPEASKAAALLLS